MKKNFVHLAILILALATMSFALPVSAADIIQKPSPPLQTVPIAPPQTIPSQPPVGSIQITYPHLYDNIIYPGGAYGCTWTATNVAAANVVLFNTGTSQVFPLGQGVTTGKLTGIVPANAPLGNYELRVASASDPRIEARQAVIMREPFVHFSAPWAGTVWPPNSLQTVQWKYYGPTVPVKLVLEGQNDGYTYPVSVPTSQIWNGQGWVRLTIPNIPLVTPPDKVKTYIFTAYRLSDNKKIGSSNWFSVQPVPWTPPSNTGSGSKK